ncbi:PssE/Cps14G family polysaccharide biosynthesis glycosyltransferase [Thalassotalea agariperforans]
MKVFVTLGTTLFPELLDALIAQNIDNKYELVIQSPAGNIENFKRAFHFIENINEWYEWADVVITHAGAGSVYRLLEQKQKLIVVPNIYRKDQHQLELANFVKSKNFALVCYQLCQLNEMLEKITPMTFDKYIKNEFKGVDLIVNTLFPKL